MWEQFNASLIHPPQEKWPLTPFLVTGYLQHREGMRKGLGKVAEDSLSMATEKGFPKPVSQRDAEEFFDGLMARNLKLWPLEPGRASRSPSVRSPPSVQDTSCAGRERASTAPKKKRTTFMAHLRDEIKYS